jgi:hypothetical protein
VKVNVKDECFLHWGDGGGFDVLWAGNVGARVGSKSRMRFRNREELKEWEFRNQTSCDRNRLGRGTERNVHEM